MTIGPRINNYHLRMAEPLIGHLVSRTGVGTKKVIQSLRDKTDESVNKQITLIYSGFRDLKPILITKKNHDKKPSWQPRKCKQCLPNFLIVAANFPAKRSKGHVASGAPLRTFAAIGNEVPRAACSGSALTDSCSRLLPLRLPSSSHSFRLSKSLTGALPCNHTSDPSTLGPLPSRQIGCAPSGQPLRTSWISWVLPSIVCWTVAGLAGSSGFSG